MPNFALSAQLRREFAPSIKTELRQEGQLILESLGRTGVQGTRAFSELQRASPTVTRLIANPNVELAMLFIDISNFSTKTINYTPRQISKVLDEYYEQVMPAIYTYNGEVEKVMGDGIVAVFGPPFTAGTTQDWLIAAEKCADTIMQPRYTHEFSVKIALHYGKLLYYHNDKTTVDDFYAIGRPMTELFRLESEGVDKRLSYYQSCAVQDSTYDQFRRSGRSTLSGWWTQHGPRAVQLKGVQFNNVIDLS